MEAHLRPFDWRECEFVSMANAARIAGREPGWAQNAVIAGVLQARVLQTGGPPVVTVASLKALLDRAERQSYRAAKRTARPAHLRLVAVN